MNDFKYFHVFANGDDARNLVICESDFAFQFNLVGISAFRTGLNVVAFSVEDSHPHFLLYGTYEQTVSFKHYYETSTRHHIVSKRGNLDGVNFELTIDAIDSTDYLKNVGCYICVQPTKDGKRVMPYDYPWGSASMYFRSGRHIPIWYIDSDNKLLTASRFGDLPSAEKRKLLGVRNTIPDDWLICNGLILPENYVNVKMFENIYLTHNCYRTFLSSGQSKHHPVIERMAMVRGVRLDDLEARTLCRELCMVLFNKETARTLTTTQRMTLAVELRKRFSLTLRQIATLVRLPEIELSKYMR